MKADEKYQQSQSVTFRLENSPWQPNVPVESSINDSEVPEHAQKETNETSKYVAEVATSTIPKQPRPVESFVVPVDGTEQFIPEVCLTVADLARLI
jgi:hypothetical protein